MATEGKLLRFTERKNKQGMEQKNHGTSLMDALAKTPGQMTLAGGF